MSISQRLDDYWHGLRLQKMDVPALHLVIDDEADVPDNSPTMMEAVETYLRLKRDKQTPTFIRDALRISNNPDASLRSKRRLILAKSKCK